MKCIVLLAVLLCGCAEERIYENGRLVAVFQGDCVNVTIKTANGTQFHADTINNSAVTKAWADVSVQGIGALAGIAAALGKIF